MNIDEMKDRIARAEEIQRYTENRCKTLEEENAELKNKLEHRNCLDCSNHSSKLRMRNLELEKENADLKEEINKIAFARGTLEEENAELNWNDKVKLIAWKEIVLPELKESE